MLLNLGSQGGPTDGTSDLARKIDATVGPGIPGLVFVTGAGDEGGVANRAGGNVPQGGSVADPDPEGQRNRARSCSTSSTRPADRFNVTIQGPSGTFGPVHVARRQLRLRHAADGRFPLRTTTGSRGRPTAARPGSARSTIRLDGPAGTYTVTLTGATVTTGRFDATLSPSDFYALRTNRFLTNVAPGSLWDGCAAPQQHLSQRLRQQDDAGPTSTGIPQSLTGQGNPGRDLDWAAASDRRSTAAWGST